MFSALLVGPFFLLVLRIAGPAKPKKPKVSYGQKILDAHEAEYRMFICYGSTPPRLELINRNRRAASKLAFYAQAEAWARRTGQTGWQ
jgi:hypothetical protein